MPPAPPSEALTSSTEYPRTTNTKRVASSLLAGALAGATAKTVIAPMERVKILFQVTDMRFSLWESKNTLIRLYHEEGLTALWRGNTATMMRIMPYAAIQFMTHDQIARNFRKPGQVEIDPVPRFMSGAIAGAAASSATYPLDLVRARMAVQLGKEKTYRNIFDGLRKVYGELGMRGLYRGLLPTLMGIMPYSGVSFFTNDTLKKAIKERTGQKEVTTVQKLMCGAVAGLCGQTSSYPLEIVRRRLQTDGFLRGKTRQTGWTIIKDIMAKDGVKGLYKGLTMNWIKGPISVATSFTTYDFVKKFLIHE
eukprot:Nk52_evm24s153 gene=Nk52_evmTU24s153